MKKIYEFAVQKSVLNSGKELYTPVVRIKRMWFPNSWQRIVHMYGRWFTLELDFDPELTYEQCEEHVKGYQNTLRDSVANDVQDVVFLKLEDI